jgi:hypothetical protein
MINPTVVVRSGIIPDLFIVKQHINKQWTELIGDDSRVGLQTQSALITDSKTVFQICGGPASIVPLPL